MKFIIIGRHCTGKMRVAKILAEHGVRVGHLLTNAELTSDIIQHNIYNHHSTSDMNSIFENDAYIFFKDLTGDMMNEYECLSKFDFENNDVFILSPQHINMTPKCDFGSKICFIWLDSTLSVREMTHRDECRKYSFKTRELVEARDTMDFVDKIYNMPNSEMLYFWNEDPQRVATIIEVMLEYPDTIGKFAKTFN